MTAVLPIAPRGLRLAAGLAAAVPFLAGCSVGPDHVSPEMPLPAVWSEPKAPGMSLAPVPAEEWWKTFNDPLLDSLIDRARRSNQDLEAAVLRLREARAQKMIARAGALPSLTAGGFYQRSRPSATLSARARSLGEEENLWHGGFDALWEIDIFGGARRSIEAAQDQVESAQEDYRDVLVTLFAEVARNYIELRGLQKEIAVARRNLEAQRDTAALVRAKFQAGLVSELDVVRAEAQAATTESQVPLLEDSRAQAIHRLGVLAGEAPGALGDELAKEAAIPPPPPEVPIGLPSGLLQRRPDIRRAERELAAACARIGAAKADLFPRFFLNGSAGLESQRFKSFGDWDSRSWSIGPSFSWPVFASGRIWANVQVQDARHQQALTFYEKTVLLSLEEVENALSRCRREKERWRALDAAVQSSRRAVALASEVYRRGLIDFLSVLEAERSLYSAESQLALSERSVSMATVALYKALGGGWEKAEEMSRAGR